MTRIYSFMSANFNIRKTLFKVIYSIARYSESNMFVRVCQEIVQMVRGTEMNHLILIEKYLFSVYPELRKLACLGGLEDSMNRARNKLSTLSVDEVLFIRILRDKNDTADLNRPHFKTAAIVATACARFEQDSMENYFMEDGERASDLASMVEEYLFSRQAAIPIQASEGAKLGKIEEELIRGKHKALFEGLYTERSRETEDTVTPIRPAI